MALKIGNGLDLQSQRIQNQADPVSAQDSATKNYVDNLINGLNWGQHVRAAALTNISVSAAPAAIDGVTGALNDRFILTAQTAPAENGPWLYPAAAGSALTRPADYTGTIAAKSARTYAVTEGTSADKAFTMQTDTAITVGTTSTAWVLVTSGLTYVAGAGLTLTGSTFDVVALDGSITVAADTITVGNVPVTKGGTGGTTAATARSGIGAVGKYAATVTTAAGTPLTINHNLGTTDVTTALYDAVSTGNEVLTDVTIVDSNNLTITTAAICTSYRIVVTG